MRLAPTFGALGRFVREDVKNWIVQPRKKPLLRQLREAAWLWRAYRFFPYQYLKNDLYLSEVGERYRDYIPSVLADRHVNAINPPACKAWLEDKFEFDARMRAAGLPVIPTLALLSLNARQLRARTPEGEPVSLAGLHQLARAHRALFVKPRHGLQGLGAFRLDVGAECFTRRGARVDETSLSGLLAGAEGFEEFLVQPYFVQHDELNRVNPLSVNTLRAITMLTAGKVDFICSILRIGGAGSETDNGSHGGYYMNADLETGAVGPVAKVQLTFAKQRVFERHATTHVAFTSIKLPHVAQVRALVERAALAFAPVRVVGWDVALGPEGPCFIEGNFHPGFRPVQDVCGGLRYTAIGRELAGQLGWG